MDRPIDGAQNVANNLQLAGIVGFRIPISRIEGKFKISQNRAPQERINVQAAQAAGTPDQQGLAVWMSRLIG